MALGRWAGGMRGPLLTAARSARLARILDSGDTLRLQYPREDLGFTYASPAAAVCHDGPAFALGTVASRKGVVGGLAGGGQGRAAPYVPSTVPGARLPHAFITVRSPGASSRTTHEPFEGMRVFVPHHGGAFHADASSPN